MHDLNLTALLSVEDFAAEEQALLHSGLECRNFRKPEAVADQLDDQNRLRFTDRINWFELVINPGQAHIGGHVKYGCELKGTTVHLKPELSQVMRQRAVAKVLAQKYRTAGGDYCFSMPIGHVQDMLNQEQVTLRFSNVRYLERIKPVTTSARLRKEAIPKFGITWRKMETADAFRDALRAHGWKVAGKKSDLVRRTAELAAERLEEAAPELDT